MTSKPHALEMGIVVTDLDTMTNFYETVLGFTRITDQQRGIGLMRRFECGDAQVKFMAPNTPPEVPASPGGAGAGRAGLRWYSITISGDLADIQEQTVAHGGTVAVPVSGTYPGGPNYLVIEDPEHNRFEILDGPISYEEVQKMSK